MELSQAISQAIKEFGKDIITEPRFVNILADYDAFAESKQMRTVVKDMVEQGFTKRIMSIEDNSNDVDEKIRSLVYLALNMFPFREDIISNFVRTVVYVLAGKIRTIQNDETVSVVSDNSPKHLSLSDILPIYDVYLGCTTVEEMRGKGYSIHTTDDKETHSTKMNGVRFWDFGMCGVFTECEIHNPHYDTFLILEKLGIELSSSYSLIKKRLLLCGFSIMDRILPVEKLNSDSQRYTLYAKFEATAFDNSFSVDFNFNYGMQYESGSLQKSKNTLYSVEIRIKDKNNIVNRISSQNNILGDVQPSDTYKTKEDFCMVGKFTLGKTTWSEAKRMGYNVEIKDDLIFHRHAKANAGEVTFWDYSKKRRFNHCYIARVREDANIPYEWRKQGLKHSLSYDEFVGLFKRWGFSILEKKKPKAKKYKKRLALSAKFVAESHDKSIMFALVFDYGNENGEGATTSSPNSLYSISVDVI